MSLEEEAFLKEESAAFQSLYRHRIGRFHHPKAESPTNGPYLQNRVVISNLFDLVEHAEKAEVGRERLLEELRGLRLELGSLRRPTDSNTDRTFYVACACLGVLVLTLFFK